MTYRIYLHTCVSRQVVGLCAACLFVCTPRWHPGVFLGWTYMVRIWSCYDDDCSDLFTWGFTYRSFKIHCLLFIDVLLRSHWLPSFLYYLYTRMFKLSPPWLVNLALFNSPIITAETIGSIIVWITKRISWSYTARGGGGWTMASLSSNIYFIKSFFILIELKSWQ